MLDDAFRFKAFAARLVIAYIALFLLTLAFPTAYARAFSPVLEWISTRAPGETRIRSLQLGPQAIHVEAESGLLRHFLTAESQPGQPFAVTSDLFINAVNVYPIVVFSLLASWPMKWKRRILAALVSVPLVLLAGVLDTWLLVQWSGAEAFAKGWYSVASMFPTTPGNAEAGQRVQESFDQLRAMKTFVSTGGRQFFSVLIAVLSVAASSVSGHRSNPGRIAPTAG